MVYVSSDGQVLDKRPWSIQWLVDMFTGTIDFVTLFFMTLFGFDNQSVQWRRLHRGGHGGGGSGPGNGPPRGPNKRIGRIPPPSDCSSCSGGSCG